MGQCSDLKGSAVRSVVLGIRLVGATAKNRDDIAEETLKSEKVQKAIHEAFRKQAGNLVKASLTGQALDSAVTLGLMGPIGKAAQPEAMKEVKKQKEYREAAVGLKNLKCAFDKTPVGVFVDENKTWLIIAGVVVGVGSAAAMYMSKSGDLPAKGLTAITGLAAKKFEVGNVTFGAKDLEFEPSKQNVKGTLGVTMGKLSPVKTEFKMGAAVKGGTLEEISFSDTVIVPLTDHTKLTATAGVGMKTNLPTYNMALAMKHGKEGLTLDVTAYVKGIGPETILGVKSNAGYRVDTSGLLGKGSYTTIGASGGLEAKQATPAAPFETSGTLNIGLTATFF
jgi:hypothetical protein